MDSAALLSRAIALRQEQRVAEALAAAEQAVALSPHDAHARSIQAQLALECGHPAAALVEAALALDPGNPGLIRNYAAALAAEGRGEEAQSVLEAQLALAPDWIDGHRLLCNLRVTGGEADFARSFATAITALPRHIGLRLAHIHTLIAARRWEEAQSALEAGAAVLGEQRGFLLARLLIASESGSATGSGKGSATGDAHLFDAVSEVRDPGLDLARVRHALRRGDLATAQVLAERHIGSASAAIFWPYCSIIWRLAGDARADWLDGAARYIQHYDLPFTTTELTDLADALRRLHTMRAPFPEQSVRGGTQTDGQLFFRDDPHIQRARHYVTEAVRHYIDALPAPDPAHPLLGAARDRILFAGSWSVRLQDAGYHSCHTHTHGWISSALYVALPQAADLGAAPAGWIAFGTPPPELGLNLSPYAQIEPKPGRLALFPSTMWHGTLPFDQGERLTIAFDVQRR